MFKFGCMKCLGLCVFKFRCMCVKSVCGCVREHVCRMGLLALGCIHTFPQIFIEEVHWDASWRTRAWGGNWPPSTDLCGLSGVSLPFVTNKCSAIIGPVPLNCFLVTSPVSYSLNYF